MGALINRLQAQNGAIDRDYPAWVAQHQAMDAHAEVAIRADIASFDDPPMISVVMPVFNPDPAHLRAAIRSVQQQIYPHWELCIADDASTDPAIGEVLRAAQAADRRIKVVQRSCNGHISAASNSALQLATGVFVALLDHDDLLARRALYEVAARIVERRDVDIVFSDEDHIDDAGHRSHPYFKPGWNPELMLGQNLISHLGVFRRQLIQRVGGFRVGFEGSQDYDLALRVVAETTADRVVHIPMVLYHWRQGAQARTFSEESHSRCVANSRRALDEFAGSDQADARVMPAPFVSVWSRLRYPVPQPEPLVSVILVADRGTPAGLQHCIDGLLHRTAYPALDVIVADRHPVFGEAFAERPALDKDPRVRCFSDPDARNDVSLRNRAVRTARGSLIVFLGTNLVVADPDWLSEMVSHAVRPQVGAVGAKLLDAYGWVRHAGLAVNLPGIAGNHFARKYRTSIGYFGHLQLSRNVTAVSGDCLMLRRTCFDEVGGFDDVRLGAAFSDVDLCLKLVEQGYRNLWTPHAELLYDNVTSTQLWARTVRSAGFPQEAAFMRERWADTLRSDSYWNPNLAVDTEELALAVSPNGNGRMSS